MYFPFSGVCGIMLIKRNNDYSKNREENFLGINSKFNKRKQKGKTAGGTEKDVEI